MQNEALEGQKAYLSKVEESIEYIEKFDILETINNVGNDEVFTPVTTCKKILDILPDEVWHNQKYKWLNPCDKNGVFLREIAIRLDKGLEDVIPDKERRRKHIMQDMLYSIGLTKFTALVSRRTNYYCSEANRKSDDQTDKDGHTFNGYAIGNGEWFDTPEGNVLTPITEHTFKKGRCIYCGTAEKQNGKYGKYSDPEQNEHYAYEFIHSGKSKLQIESHLQNRFFKGDKTMKFDIIIGNPPYQLSDGGAQASAKPIYNLFVDMARCLNPQYISFIIPSRWMAGGKGLDDFRNSMIKDKRIIKMEDYLNPKECFPQNDIKGGVSYFLWDRDNSDKLCNINTHYCDGYVEKSTRLLEEKDIDVFVRSEMQLSIYRKCGRVDSFSKRVSSRKPYGLSGDVFTKYEKYGLPPFTTKPFSNSLKVYGLYKKGRVERYVDSKNPKLEDKMKNTNNYKVFLPESNGTGAIGEVLPTPIIGEPIVARPGEICTETYLSIGSFKTLNEAKNCESYIKTKFFRTLLNIKKITQHNTKETFELVPDQDFSKPWTDKELYEKYNLSQDEIDYIEKYVESMD